jgi:hypothetical protein
MATPRPETSEAGVTLASLSILLVVGRGHVPPDLARFNGALAGYDPDTIGFFGDVAVAIDRLTHPEAPSGPVNGRRLQSVHAHFAPFLHAFQAVLPPPGGLAAPTPTLFQAFSAGVQATGLPRRPLMATWLRNCGFRPAVSPPTPPPRDADTADVLAWALAARVPAPEILESRAVDAAQAWLRQEVETFGTPDHGEDQRGPVPPSIMATPAFIAALEAHVDGRRRQPGRVHLRPAWVAQSPPPPPAIPGQICEVCFDAPAVAFVQGDHGMEMGICTACQHSHGKGSRAGKPVSDSTSAPATRRQHSPSP